MPKWACRFQYVSTVNEHLLSERITGGKQQVKSGTEQLSQSGSSSRLTASLARQPGPTSVASSGDRVARVDPREPQRPLTYPILQISWHLNGPDSWANYHQGYALDHSLLYIGYVDDNSPPSPIIEAPQSQVKQSSCLSKKF